MGWHAIDGSDFYAAGRMTEALRVLFVCQNDFGAPSEKQVLAFARELARFGHAVLISFAGDPESVAREHADNLPGLETHCHEIHGRGPRRQDVDVARAFRPSLVHVWNSRAPTVAVARAYCDATGAALFVHFEDDEWRVPPHPPGELWLRKVAHVGRRLLSPVRPGLWWHSTWLSRRYVSRHAAGFDALTPTLAREVKQLLGRDCDVVLPVTLQVEPEAAAEAPALPASATTVE